MTPKERLVKTESIIRRQRAGKITPVQASVEMDALLDTNGAVHYNSDTTERIAFWNGQPVMRLIRPDGSDSNTGLVTQGQQRGLFVSLDGEAVSNAALAQLQHFGYAGEQLTK